MTKVIPVNKRQPDTSRANRTTDQDERKPFVVPELRREADLVSGTAERSFTFNASGGS